MRFHLEVLFVLLVATVQNIATAATVAKGNFSNCGVDSGCDDCLHGSIVFRYLINLETHMNIICCKSCAQEFRYGVDRDRETGIDYPWCICDYDLMRGTCLKGDVCDYGPHVVKVNNLPVCCRGNKAMRLTPNECNCVD